MIGAHQCKFALLREPDRAARKIPQEVRKRMKKTLCLTLLFLGAAILLSVGIPVGSTHAADGPQITIAYSSNLLGYMEPCG